LKKYHNKPLDRKWVALEFSNFQSQILKKGVKCRGVIHCIPCIPCIPFKMEKKTKILEILRGFHVFYDF